MYVPDITVGEELEQDEPGTRTRSRRAPTLEPQSESESTPKPYRRRADGVE